MPTVKLSASPKDVGAAKGSADPGDEDNLGMDSKDKQMPGGSSKAPVTNESASDNDSGLAMRGMSSSIAAKLWPKGKQAPTSQADGNKK